MMAWAGIAASSRAPIRWRVLALSGTWTEITSEEAIRSMRSSTLVTPAFAISSADTNGS